MVYVYYYIHALWLFDVAKGGEKMGTLEIKILYLLRFKLILALSRKVHWAKTCVILFSSSPPLATSKSQSAWM